MFLVSIGLVFLVVDYGLIGNMIIFLVVRFVFSYSKVLLILLKGKGFFGSSIGFIFLFFSNGFSFFNIFLFEYILKKKLGGVVVLDMIITFSFFFIVFMVLFFCFVF